MAFNWLKKSKNKKKDLEKNQEIADIRLTETLTFADSDNKPAVKPAGIIKNLQNRLSKSRKKLSGGLETIFSGKKTLDDDLIEEIEELLITADIGVKTTTELIQSLLKHSGKITGLEDLKTFLKEQIQDIFEKVECPSDAEDRPGPEVIVVVGVNGVGKTTTIGKLASKAVNGGQKVLIGAADTFRAAANEQLEVWAERAGAEIVRHKENTDPAAVAYDSVDAAMARKADLVLIDTAGRLHTKLNLMEELKKIKRSVSKKLPGAPHEILLVLDATTGQNAVNQAKMFHESIGVTQIALTKLDGTAKGGIAVSICSSLEIPLRYIGIGEQIEDLQNFDPANFVNALL